MSDPRPLSWSWWAGRLLEGWEEDNIAGVLSDLGDLPNRPADQEPREELERKAEAAFEALIVDFRVAQRDRDGTDPPPDPHGEVAQLTYDHCRLLEAAELLRKVVPLAHGPSSVSISSRLACMVPMIMALHSAILAKQRRHSSRNSVISVRNSRPVCRSSATNPPGTSGNEKRHRSRLQNCARGTQGLWRAEEISDLFLTV